MPVLPVTVGAAGGGTVAEVYVGIWIDNGNVEKDSADARFGRGEIGVNPGGTRIGLQW